jgi:2-(1,2-epoxy-1,2-dihydrophenyl)acetyl-CoA isomerase
MPELTVDYLREDDVVTLTLNRPDTYNALDIEMGEAIMGALNRANDDEGVRALVLRSKGPHFSPGGNLKKLFNIEMKRSAFFRRLTLLLNGIVSSIARAEFPVIAAVQGLAAGAGLSIAMSCDMVAVADDARLTPGYLNTGLVPNAGITHVLPRLVGPKKAFELFAMNRILDADSSIELGLANWVFPSSRLHAEADAIAHRMAVGPTFALVHLKALIRESVYSSFETQLESERLGICASADTEDFDRGLKAFKNKTKPDFKGK